MALLTIVQPVQEPVSLAQFKSYARIGTTADDELCTELITAARAWCENFMERSILFQTKRLLLDFFPGYVDFKMTGQKVSSPFVSGANAVLVGIRYAIVLPFPQVREIVDFVYQDQNGNNQTMVEAVSYNADLDSQPARLTPPFGNMWPVARVVPNAVQVDYVTGSQGPITVSLTAGSAAVTSNFTFLPRDVGTVLTIPGAGPAVGGQPGPLTTSIAAVDGNGDATLAVAASASVANTSVWFDGMPQMRMIKNAIKALAHYWYENKIPDTAQIPDGVKAMLSPFRDLRF
jgi:hypothetical protein